MPNRSSTNEKADEPLGLFGQLKQRKVFKVTSVYAVASWGGVLGAIEVLPRFGFSDTFLRWMVVLAIVLIPVVALIAWLYELTPQGVKRDNRSFHQHGNPLTATQFADHANKIAVRWRGELHRFETDFTIGRDPACELHLDDPQISRRHAQVFYNGGRWQVRDLASRNGLTIDGKLTEKATLAPETTIQLYPDAPPVSLTIM